MLAPMRAHGIALVDRVERVCPRPLRGRMLSLGARQMATENESAPPSTEVSHSENEATSSVHRPLVNFRLFQQLKQRNVFRVATLYLVVCWLILEPVHVVFHMLDVPVWANRLVLMLMAVGFPAVVIFAWVYEVTPEGLKPTAEVPHGHSIRRLTGRRLDRAIIAVLAVALAYFVADKFLISKRLAAPQPVASVSQGSTERTSTAPVAPAFAPPPHSIAVLPFVDMSEHQDQEYFSDGLAEELLDLLSQVPDLRVPARTSSFYFKGRRDDIATIAQKLRVAHVLEGSVRRSGNRIRVTAQLIRADNGYHLWSKTYDRVDKDIFEVQDDIANAVVSALKARLLSPQPLAIRHRTDNTEAYTEYLLGNQLRERDTSDSNRQALDAYRRAVALDSGYAAAYAGIADTEWRIADMITGEAAAYQRSLEAAQHAIALAPDLADGYWARGALRMDYNYDWPGAEADFKKALELDPNDVRVLRDYGTLLATRNRSAEALAVMRKSVALDPLSAVAWYELAKLQLDLRQLAEAEQAAQYLESAQPEGWKTRSIIGQIALAEGRPADALAEFNKVDSGIWKLIGGAIAEHTLGHAAASQAALEELIRKYAARLAYQIAEVYAWRDERDAAFTWLERAHRQRDGGMGYLPHDYFFAPLRDDPRYKDMLKKLNLL